MLGIDLQLFYIIQAFAASAISAALIVYLIPQWHTPSTRSLLLLMGSVAIWSFCYGMEFKSPALETKLGWVRAEYLGAAWTGLLFFRFSMAISGRKSWLAGPKSWSLLIVPLLTLVGVYTNDRHHLIWVSAWIESSGPVPTMAYLRGIGFWVFVGFSYSLLLAATLVLFHTFLGTGKLERRNFFVLMVGLAAPWVSNILYLIEIAPIRHLDLTPFAFAISGVTFFWGVIRHQILELIPIARDAVIESMKDAVFVLDLQNRVIDLNTVAKQMISAKTAAIVGKTLSALFPDLYELMNQSLMSGTDDAEMSVAIHGTMVLWRIRISKLYGSGQTPCGRLITLQDITEQRRNEIALRESEEKFRSISANALDGIIMIDPSGRVSFWNKAAEQIFGYHQDEILGKDLHGHLAPKEYQTQFRNAFSGFQRTGNGQVLGKTIEIQCVRKSGDIFPAELSLSPLKLNGQWHAVGIVRDITERKKTQEYLIQTEKMISLGGLAAGMAHEINNPLAGILSSIQVMRMRLLSDLPANLSAAEECGLDFKQMWAYLGKRGIMEMIEAIDQSCQRAATIVRNMLAFSRKSDAVFSNQDLAELVDQTVVLAGNDFHFKRRHDFRQIKMVRDYAPHMPPIACDATQIQQVLLNIFKNGAQAMWETAERHRAPQFILKVYADREHGCISITDNGPGMNEETRKRIFEPFYTTKPTGSGTGLGLSIAYFIVTENHDGILSVAAAPEKGTTFTVKLPLKRRVNHGP
ncbi:MAG: PAS domain S-box protein [Deltaproteobacteria bacterium]|nr:PAS domain S-box protein [Deltaproteobacteria bacterium]